MKKISSCSVQGMVCRLHFTQNYLAALEQKGWKSRKARCAPDADIRAGTIYVFSPLGPLLRTLSIGDTTCAHEAVASHNNDDVLMVGGKSGIVSAWDLESGCVGSPPLLRAEKNTGD
jgi:WD40 repeat protein